MPPDLQMGEAAPQYHFSRDRSHHAEPRILGAVTAGEMGNQRLESLGGCQWRREQEIPGSGGRLPSREHPRF